MRRIIIMIIAAVACASYVGAQSRTTLVQRINEIKSQTDVYSWDQYTHPNADTAKIGATRRLLIDVNGNRSETAQLTVEELMPHAGYINIDRGNLKQVFAYIKKTDAAAISGGTASPRVAKPTAAVPVLEPTPAVTPPIKRSFVPDAFVQRIMETKDFMNIYKLLKSLQAQGQVLQFGKLKDVEDYSSFDLILFDMQSQEVITMLSPVNASGYRTNMVNGGEDSLDNYPTQMTAVIWYIKK